MNPEISDRQHLIELVYYEEALTSAERAVVVMIVVEDLTEDSCAADLFLEEREGVVRFCGWDLSTGGSEDMAHD